MANGVACSSVKLGKAAVTDAAGNVRIHLGSAGQPIQCSTAGATVTFVRADGATLYEKRTLLPGVTQMIENLAPEAPFDGTTPAPPATKTVAPAAPNAGNQGPATGPAGSDSPPWLLALGGLAVLLGVVGAGLMFRRP